MIFPVSTCATNVVYYFTAETVGGDTQFWPTGAPIETFSALSASSITTVFEDDFETDTGWTISTTAADGPWQRAVPIPNSTCNRGNPGADADGSGMAYVTDNSAADSCNSDVDNGSTTLTSPFMDASAGDMFITYWRWYDNTVGNNPNQDVFVVDVNDGSGWVNLEVVGPIGSENAGGWFQKTFAVEDFVSATSQFQIRFIASDTDPQSVVEAGVDGLELINIGCDAGCPWDCDGSADGAVNVVDLLALLGQYDAEAPNNCTGGACDFDGSGCVDVVDLLKLLNHYDPAGVGCP